MSTFQAQQLVENLAKISKKERESFSKREILKKVNEIKYLSSQKKVPKLTLRKQIQHLESSLKGVFELEKKLLQQKSKESTKVSGLKKQITTLKKRLAAVEDKDLSKKVEKLSFLLGEYLAKTNVKDNVELHSLMKDITGTTTVNSKRTTRRPTLAKAAPKSRPKVDPQRLALLQKRLDALKQEFQIRTAMGKANTPEMKILQSQIKLIETKLKEFEASAIPASNRHTMILSSNRAQAPKKVEIDHLPLPPPPRIHE